MRRVLLVLLPMLVAAPALAWEWDGAGWADYRPFLGSIDAAVKTNLQAIVAAGAIAGRVEGRMGQIGDSITESSAYFRNATLNGVSGNETGHDYVPIRSWLSYEGLLPPDANSFYRDHGKGAGLRQPRRLADLPGDGGRPSGTRRAGRRRRHARPVLLGAPHVRHQRHRRRELERRRMEGGLPSARAGLRGAGCPPGSQHDPAGAGARGRRPRRGGQSGDRGAGRRGAHRLGGLPRPRPAPPAGELGGHAHWQRRHAPDRVHRRAEFLPGGADVHGRLRAADEAHLRLGGEAEGDRLGRRRSGRGDGRARDRRGPPGRAMLAEPVSGRHEDRRRRIGADPGRDRARRAAAGRCGR